MTIFRSRSKALNALYKHETESEHRNSKKEAEEQEGTHASESQNKGSLDDEDKKINVFIAEQQFSLSLYSLSLDTSAGMSNLNPEFLNDFLTLPDQLYSVDSAKKYQRFINKYGTHVVSASEFGGEFVLQMVSKSTSFTSFGEFDTSSKTEMDSMRGSSTSRNEQIGASQDTQTGSDVYEQGRQELHSRVIYNDTIFKLH